MDASKWSHFVAKKELIEEALVMTHTLSYIKFRLILRDLQPLSCQLLKLTTTFSKLQQIDVIVKGSPLA
ncbi:hypothetical protein S2091_0963 [Solimicrobium silvestre]|uniref:Uncharacterized protein n=1 Tax=Solimicrobium silvestre TaxID=2099400 RepID=A0A2S9H2Y3_9BURK|nr:hypothetical protein S2091_0963 [Solimicrobium silvestre]